MDLFKILSHTIGKDLDLILFVIVVSKSFYIQNFSFDPQFLLKNDQLLQTGPIKLFKGFGGPPLDSQHDADSHLDFLFLLLK